MHKYQVVEVLADNGLCALQCSFGRYHLIRPLGNMPGLGLKLAGDKPHLGFGILRCTTSSAMFRVIFESINDRARAPGPVPAPGAHGPPSAGKRRDLEPSGRGH